MAISTVEFLLRRRSFCTFKLHPPRAVSPVCHQALDHSDLPTQRISRASRSPPLRVRRERRKQKILEAQTVIPFTHISNFHSRKLPPLGTHAHNLDLPFGYIDTFHVGQTVKVRRFLQIDNRWTNWEIGTVIEKSRFHGFVGTNARGYIVSTICPTTHQSIERKYAIFLAEICGLNDSEPDITPEECVRWRTRADWIYTRLPIPETINNVSMSRIWIPAYVLAWKEGNRIRVSARAGPKAGQEFDVMDALPFTLETANACRLSGYYVMETDGELKEPPGRPIFLPAETVKPRPSFSGFRLP
ncbi:hypothetical protein L208DRAFT_807082 [Tricholoma matsutake]|nr:hypothetical protein L208DRAFT_807082 [Tricholoma matsutake 945]